jgi:hypothetical protein
MTCVQASYLKTYASRSARPSCSTKSYEGSRIEADRRDARESSHRIAKMPGERPCYRKTEQSSDEIKHYPLTILPSKIFIFRAGGLNQFHDPNLRIRVGLDVALGGAKVRVSRKHLNVPERSVDRGYLPRGIGDESASAAVT